MKFHHALLLLRVAHPSVCHARACALTVCLLLLAACAAVPPKLVHPTLTDNAPLAGLDTTARAGWPQAQWWRSYGDAQLDDLIARA
ncbi:MAG: hypothetical protein ABI300_00480, partial [Rhodanobacter sp.]